MQLGAYLSQRFGGWSREVRAIQRVQVSGPGVLSQYDALPNKSIEGQGNASLRSVVRQACDLTAR